MATSILAPTQPHVQVTVDYYDQHHKTLLSKYGSAASIAATAGKIYAVPIEEFLTYFLFLDKDGGVDGFRSYSGLMFKADRAETMLNGIAVFDGSSIHLEPHRTNYPSGFAERFGEAIGLSIINEIHGIHGADWDRIPTATNPLTDRQHPIFDYRIASDGKDLVQVELKGTCQLDVKEKSPAVSNHKKKIEDKKAKIRNLESTSTYPYPCSVKYGTIAVVGNVPKVSAHCWLLDPPALEVQLNSVRLKLIHRMRFLSRWISSVGPRTQVATALANRLHDLEHLRDYTELDGLSLVNARGENFEFEVFEHKLSAWFNTRSRVIGESIGGVVVQLMPGRFFFAGFDQNLLDIALEQNHRRISEFSYKPGSEVREVECVMTEHRFKSLEIEVQKREEAEADGGYVRFRMKGRIHQSREGLAFGWLDWPSDKEE